MADLDFPLKSFKEHCQMMNGLKPPNEKKEQEKGGKTWKRGKKGKDWSKTEVTPKGQRKGEEDEPCPKGREPNPELMGGEGIEPYELYSHDLYSLERLMAEQACAWYMMADIRAYSRSDEVILPPLKPPLDTLKERAEDMKQEK